ncbi:MAG: hypothetical protein LBF97_08150 [Elusimicrobiota bacterium]|jgi:hypothetical protein|nr:hypothetical protein [Elusimicrobiota bacterium]
MKVEDAIFEYLCDEADNAGVDILDESVIKAITDKAHFLAGEAKKAGKEFKHGFNFQRQDSKTAFGKSLPKSNATDVNTKPVDKVTRIATKAGMAVGKAANSAEEKAVIAIAKAYAHKNDLVAEFNKWKATGETKLSEFKNWLKSHKKDTTIKESYFNY